MSQPQERGGAGVELGAEHVGVGGIVELVGNVARRCPMGAEPSQRPPQPGRHLATEINASDIAQRVGKLQEPEILPRPKGRAVHRLASGAAAMGQDGGAEAIDDRLYPYLRLGVLAQQVQSGHAKVPIVHDSVVPTFLRVALLLHIRPPALQLPHETGADPTFLVGRQLSVQQVKGQGKSLHVAIGRVEMFLHPVVVVPTSRRPQPSAGPVEPAPVAGQPPSKGIVLDQGRGLHGSVEGQIKLVVRVRTVRPSRDPQPRPLSCIQLTVV